MEKSTEKTATDSSPAGTARSERLLSLDAFRGLTVLAMVMVNNPGSWRAMYWPLRHVEWHGWSPTDLIFPFFLFIVGTSLAYSLRKYLAAPGDSPGAKYEGAAHDKQKIDNAVYWRIVRRTALLIFFGWFPSLLFRTIDYASGASASFDLEHLRLPGVLVRIGLVYFFASLIVLHVSRRGQIVFAIVALLGYWALLGLLPNPGEYVANLTNDGNVVGLVDRTLLGLNHMYRAGGNTDPEGLLSTLPAVVTALFGYWTGLFIQRGGLNYRMVVTLAIAGLLLAAVGQGWHYAFPINKKLWTSSFVLLTSGLAMTGLAGCVLIFDLWGWRRSARPFAIVGMNAILVFVGSGLLSTTLNRWKIGDMNAHDWLLAKITGTTTAVSQSLDWAWMADPKFASLCYSLVIVAFWWIVCWVMARRGWVLKV